MVAVLEHPKKLNVMNLPTMMIHFRSINAPIARQMIQAADVTSDAPTPSRRGA
jgi:hypothetical protein